MPLITALMIEGMEIPKPVPATRVRGPRVIPERVVGGEDHGSEAEHLK